MTVLVKNNRNETLAGAITCTGGLTVNSTLTVGDAKNVALGTTTGTKIGTSASQKLGFFNATPVVQQASANQAAVGADPTNAELATLVNALRSALVSLGLIKGSA